MQSQRMRTSLLLSFDDVDEAFFAQVRQNLHDIGPALVRRHLELGFDRRAKIGHRPGLLEGIPNAGTHTLKSEIDRAFRMKDRDFLVDLAGDLMSRSLESGSPKPCQRRLLSIKQA